MGQFARAYSDQTHVYRLQKNAIIMAPRGQGEECQLTFGSASEARAMLRWLINKGQLRKEKLRYAH